uniref:Putative secreted protein n=1 Tax=Ixodes ricinus TaxID=34613 RepID=A0A6B0UAX4_IXORI
MYAHCFALFSFYLHIRLLWAHTSWYKKCLNAYIPQYLQFSIKQEQAHHPCPVAQNTVCEIVRTSDNTLHTLCAATFVASRFLCCLSIS